MSIISRLVVPSAQRTLKTSFFASHRPIGCIKTNQFVHSLLTSKIDMSTSAVVTTPIVEIREYNLHPEHVVEYVKITTENSDLRKSLTPLRIFSMPETGGMLNVATHFYHFSGGFQERDERRKLMGENAEWKTYLKSVKPCMINQKSTIFVEAPFVATTDEVCGLNAVASKGEEIFGDQSNSDCIFEIRRYHLKLGYDTVPQFLKLYTNGLPSKLNAVGTDPTTSLVTLLYSEVGQLNEVVEVWRHGGGTSAMERSRVAARGATEWRESISKIAELANVFTNTIHKPLSFSPLR